MKWFTITEYVDQQTGEYLGYKLPEGYHINKIIKIKTTRHEGTNRIYVNRIALCGKHYKQLQFDIT